MSATAIYREDQIQAYYKHVGFSPEHNAKPSYDLLNTLLQLQLSRVPFECLALHYSKTKSISLDAQDLYKKIVEQSRGGYCLENNAFFKYILQSIGFHVTSVICRISNASRGIHDGGWRAMSHMANIVSVNARRYLIDVGYGADGPTHPIPLESGLIVDGLPGQTLRLEHKSLVQHADTASRVWVYTQKRDPGEWIEIYHFLDVEIFGPDFDVLNHWNMVRSSFAQNVVVQRFTSDDDSAQMHIVGSLLLVRDTLKLRNDNGEMVLHILKTEEERIQVFKKYFDITLNEEQRGAICGGGRELK